VLHAYLIQTQYLLPIALAIFSNLITQDLELLADDGLEIENAALGEHGTKNGAMEAVQMVV
jgi:hypothetical protein